MVVSVRTLAAEAFPLDSVRRWLFTTDHKDIGILYLVTSFYFLLVGGALSLLIRLQLAYPGATLLTGSSYNQAVTIHGLVMVLWFLSPFAFGLANYVVPLQIGARDLAFPRLNALSYWLYLVSGLLAALGFFTPGGAIATGWTVYAPLSGLVYSGNLGVTLGAAGLLLLFASVTLGSVNFLVTIFRLRAPGMTLMRMPMFTWGILLTAFMMLFAFPSIAAAVLLLAADRLLGTAYFTSPEGGALLWAHLFWFFGHPEVYIVLMPGLMALAEILPIFARRPLYGKRVILAAACVATAMSFAVWAHHMFITGIDPSFRKFMTVTTESISIPFGVITLMLILTLVKGSIRFTTPMLFALAAVVLFIIGGITGVFNSSVALDYHLRGTYWVVAHFHYTMVGGAVTGLLAALYYWWPKITGRLYSEAWGRRHFVLYLVGFNLLYGPLQFLVDMPRRVSTYGVDTGWWTANWLASIGAILFGLSWLLLFVILYRSLRNGEPAGANPWDAWSLEWLIPSPAPREDFPGSPSVREDGTISIEERIGREAHGHPSPRPLVLAAGAFLTFLGVGLGLPLLVLGLLVFAAGLAGWVRDGFAGRAHVPEPERAERWPFARVDKERLGVWFFLFSEVVLFGSLFSAYLFVRMNSASWPAAGEILDPSHGATNTYILLTSSLMAVLALGAIKAGSTRGLKVGLLATFALGLAFLVNKALEWQELFAHGFTLTGGLPATTFYTTTGVHGVHVAVGLVILGVLLAKAFRGGFTPADHRGVEHFGLYWHFVDIIWVFLFPLFYLM